MILTKYGYVQYMSKSSLQVPFTSSEALVITDHVADSVILFVLR